MHAHGLSPFMPFFISADMVKTNMDKRPDGGLGESSKEEKKADDEAAEAALLVLGKNSKINPSSEFICEYLMRVSPFSPKTL